MCSTALEPILFAVGLLVMNLHSAFWTYTSQMQISKAVSTSDIFIKPWWAFAQVSMTTMTTMLSCKSGCSLSARIPDSAPCKPGFYQNHPPDVFPCEFITLALTFFEIINKYICFKSVIWMLNFPLFPLSLIPQNLQLKDQRWPRHPVYSHAVLQSTGSISCNYRWEYACRSKKWMDIWAILFRNLQLLRNNICINFCFDGNGNFYLQQKYVSIFLKAPTHLRLDSEVIFFQLLLHQSA